MRRKAATRPPAPFSSIPAISCFCKRGWIANQADTRVLRSKFSHRRHYVNVAAASAADSRPQEIIDEIGKSLGIQKMEDWYKVSHKAIEETEGGSKILARYTSLELALKASYPDFAWANKFTQTRSARYFFDDVDKQRELLEQIGQELGVKELENWYGIAYSQVARQGGWRILRKYDSLESVLRAVYPGYEWDHALFLANNRAKGGYWQDRSNLLAALTRAESQLKISQPEDWYTVNLADLKEVGFPGKVTKPTLIGLLEEKYPNFAWESVGMLRGRYAQQKRLEKAVEALFKGAEIKINARKEADIINPETKDYLELDVFIPSLHLAFEYQEKHHYTSSDYIFKPLEQIQSRDREKIELAASKGITLITIPCWWDGRTDSLIATIKKIRPDLLTDISTTAAPIAQEVPQQVLKKYIANVDGIGEPITACFFTVSNINPAKWWMFEKYDGVRGFWNPEKKAFYARTGKQFTFPQHVIDDMPKDIFLDGELWFGRDNFQESMKISNRMVSTQINWDSFKYMVFDAPKINGTYEQRYNHLVKQLGNIQCKYIDVATFEQCRDTPHLEHFYQNVIDKGGEGVILRDPYSPYVSGRSPGFLKHKKFRDAEAKVVSNVGPLQWECELPNGVRFVAPAGTTEFAKRWNPQPGDIISFKHHGYLLASKKPKFPTIYRLRTDIVWDDVTNNWKEQKTEPNMLPMRRAQPRAHPKGYWNNPDNITNFFVDFAEEMEFDPFVAENWKTVTLPDIISKKGVGPLWKFNYSLASSLKAAFADPNFKELETRNKDHFWEDVNNCRAFFDEYAKEKGFDPLKPENWYAINLREVLVKKGGFTVRKTHGGLRKALQLAYPEVQFSQW